MAQIVSCSSCSYSFCNKVDLSTRSRKCACCGCGAHFRIIEEGIYGSSIGSNLEIYHVKTSKKGRVKEQLLEGHVKVERVGKFDPVIEGLTEEVQYFVEYRTSHICCPVCRGYSIITAFEEGANCPTCRVVKLDIKWCEP